MPKVFILILNWNGWQDTVECVASCRTLDYPDFRIVVIDNGSTDDSEKILRERCADVCILQTGTNLGFAGGNNVGIRYALEHGADYVWLLNNDTTVDPAALSELVKVAEGDRMAGMVGSKVMKFSEPEIIDFARGTVDLRLGTTRHVGRGEKDAGQYDETVEADYLTGSSLLVKKEVVENIGPMSEEYFLYYEETDWCFRAKRQGYKLLTAPASRIYHKVHASVRKTSGSFTYYIIRNRLFFLERFGESARWARRFYDDLVVIKNTVKKDPGLLLRLMSAFIKAYVHWLTGKVGPLGAPQKKYQSFWGRKLTG